MTFRLSLKNLVAFSRQMATMLEAGLPIRRSLSVLERDPRTANRNLYRAIGGDIEQGRSFAEALEARGRAFPALFKRLVAVGETAGGLDLALKRLADYYDFIRTMWRRFFVRLTYPMIQYVLMILVLAVATYFLELVHQTNRDPTWPAVRILIIGIVIFFLPFVLYFSLTRLLGGRRWVHELLTRFPFLGRLVRTFALARFSYSMEMMTGSGVRIFDAIKWSLEATANGAYEARCPQILESIRNGVPLFESLEKTGLFPYDYIQMLHTAEESGSMPDIFGRLSRNYFEKAEAAIKVLAVAMSFLIWIAVAGAIIYYIFVFAGMYISAISGFSGT